MIFDSTVFLFIFLPIALLLYYLIPARFKNPMLVLLSLIFYAWGNPIHVIILCVVIIWNYLGGLVVAGRVKNPAAAAKTAWIVIGVNLFILILFKYIGRIFQIAGNNLSENRFFLVPIGISFFMLQNIAYIIDIWHGEARAQRSLVKYAVFIAMFPKVIAGPLVTYSDFEKQLNRRKLSWKKFSEGLLLFICGLAKKTILGTTLATAFASITAVPEQMSVLSAWIGCILFALQIYFSFGGYCDMARGLAKMFGFELPENVDYPYLSTGIMEFWSRWISSLWKWFLNYVYIPLCGGNPNGLGGFFAILITWGLIGLWHGLNLTFIMWGLYFGILLYLEGFIIGEKFKKIPAILKWVGTMILLMISWVFFFSANVGSAFSYLGHMIGIGAEGVVGAGGFSPLIGYIVLLVISGFAATPVLRGLHEDFTSGSEKWRVVVNCAIYVVLFLLCIAGIAAGLTQGFFYFRF